MKRLGRRSLLIPLCMFGILALVGGIAFAAIPGSDGKIDACYEPGQSSLRVIDTEAGATCRPQEKSLSWNQTGPAGPAGPQGPAGPRGPSDGYHASVLPFEDVEIAASGADTHVISLSLPAGAYILTTTMNLQRSKTGTSLVQCGHHSGGGAFAGGYSESLNGDQDYGTMAITDRLDLESARTVHLRCFATSDGNRAVFADMTAIAVGTLHTQ